MGRWIPAFAGMTIGVGVACAPPPKPPPQPKHPNAHEIFELVAPGVVAIVNDDAKDRDEEIKEHERMMGDEIDAPKHVIDVSVHHERTPNGTGFVLAGGNVVTAAHVVHRPDRLKITTRAGQTVDAELVHIDEIRDLALLAPKTPLTGVEELHLAAEEPVVGEAVWAMGHTGQGSWTLGWGMSAGIASGAVDMYGSKLVLFDAPVYPGFSGGPVVTLDAMGEPRVVGINHAILFTGQAGFFAPIGSISSAVLVTQLEDVLAKKPHPLEKTLAAFAAEHRTKVYADVFITDEVNVFRDANEQPVAYIRGNANAVEANGDDTRVPAVAMIFGLPEGEQTVTFEVKDPDGQVIAKETRVAKVAEHQRVSFVGSALRFVAKLHGRHSIVVKHGDTPIGRAGVTLVLAGDDNELVEQGDIDLPEDGHPDVDVVVAEAGNDDPLMLAGIRAGWFEKSYPRRVTFNWFARATRGWVGADVTVTAFVLDDAGKVVGRADGCFFPELRPEKTWTCVGGGQHPALVTKEGKYDLVFAVNDRPVAWWPMEAAVRKDQYPGSTFERWARERNRVRLLRAPPKELPPTPAAPKAPPAKR